MNDRKHILYAVTDISNENIAENFHLICAVYEIC